MKNETRMVSREMSIVRHDCTSMFGSNNVDPSGNADGDTDIAARLVAEARAGLLLQFIHDYQRMASIAFV